MNLQRILAGASGFIECGTIIAALVLFPEWLAGVVLAGLAYQLGCFFHRFSGTKFTHPILLAGAVALWLADYAILAFYFLTFGIAWALQEARAAAGRAATVKIGTFEKRVYRIGGFFLSSLFAIIPFGAIILLLGGLYVALLPGSVVVQKSQRIPVTLTQISAAPILFASMIFHQMQYFVYAYAVWFPLKTVFAGGVVWLPTLFALGWITYIFSEKLFGGYDDRTVLVLCHLILAAILLAIWTSPENLLVVILWIATGFFGGSVYCFARLNKNGADLALAEDLGHLLGAGASLMLVLYLRDWRPTFVCAALFACAVVVLIAQMNTVSFTSRNHGEQK